MISVSTEISSLRVFCVAARDCHLLVSVNGCCRVFLKRVLYVAPLSERDVWACFAAFSFIFAFLLVLMNLCQPQ